MGILIGMERVAHEWPNKRVLDDLTIGIMEGERIGIVGKNGDGKSTLLEIAAHVVVPDSGSVTWRNNIHVGYLGQSDSLDDAETVCHAVVGDTPEYVWASEPRIRGIIDELIGDLEWEGLVGELSGGQRRRCDLARVLIGTWDVMLMDEPTNHLDMGVITWLAGALKRYWSPGQGALLVVTHDRWFLDEVCEHMWEVHDREVTPFEGGYSAYIQQRCERDRQAAVMEERRQNTLRKELSWLAHGPKARTSKPKFRIEAARELIANDPPLRNPLELKRLAVSRLGKKVITMKNVGFSYPGTEAPVVDGIDWLIGPGDRYGILGENGAGKSTLLQLMTGRLAPTRGRVEIGASVKFGWMSQHLDALSDKEDWRLLEILSRYKRSYLVGGKMLSPTQLCERLGFDQREFQSFVSDLSGGQRRRLALLCVILDEPNVLVLDEPGNDLDTDMLAVLEDLLDSWPGTLLVVSHDRYLMERVTDDQYALIGGQVRHVPGGVDEYLSLVSEKALGASRGASAGSPEPGDEGTGDGSPALSNTERRELKKRYDAVSRRLEKLDGEPDRLRAKMADVDPSNYAGLMAAQAAVDECEQEQAALEEEWLELSEKLGL
ncbi:ABC-F family ATP-binding cassette domain-containing protein [Paratractidigestivibacter sp.]|uniref:ABC-F family ATP-binding cassette domain-containing protein n=1 Tax=Paratractidigestivibacter sp. TaxID=2847316 RepID=UPI002ABD66FF|nr:ABC-F family ATP-binding cassette domain-containing protein [Paratractidigestivibacter sp.]